LFEKKDYVVVVDLSYQLAGTFGEGLSSRLGMSIGGKQATVQIFSENKRSNSNIIITAARREAD
jgi:hypothetical protein